MFGIVIGLLNFAVGCGSVTAVPGITVATFTPQLTPLSPWRFINAITKVPLHSGPALWSDGSTGLLAWPESPSTSGIRLVALDQSMSPNEGKVLPLGRVPRNVLLLPAETGSFHLLWLDQTLPGETQLAEALIDANGNVQRIPSVINNRPTVEFYAVSNSSGDLIVLWIAAGDSPSLYLQLVDRQARPQAPIRVAKIANHPTAAFDTNGTLHLAWLEPRAEHLWTIHYVTLNINKIPASDQVSSSMVGIISLEADQTLQGFTLGADASNLYCLWNTVSTTRLNSGKLNGLVFPINDTSAVHSLNTDTLKGYSVHDISLATHTLPSLTVALVASLPDAAKDNTNTSTKWHEAPAAVVVTSNGTGDLRPVYNAAESDSLISRPTLVAIDNGALYMAWTDLHENGIANVYYTTTR